MSLNSSAWKFREIHFYKTLKPLQGIIPSYIFLHFSSSFLFLREQSWNAAQLKLITNRKYLAWCFLLITLESDSHFKWELFILCSVHRFFGLVFVCLCVCSWTMVGIFHSCFWNCRVFVLLRREEQPVSFVRMRIICVDESNPSGKFANLKLEKLN